MDPTRRRPSPETLAWVERSAGSGLRVAAVRRLTGGIASSVHRVTLVGRDGRRRHLVLRRWLQSERAGDWVERETAVLEGLVETGLAAPTFVAACASGVESGGVPSVLMTRVPGVVWLTPSDMRDWVGQTARMLVRIHQSEVPAPPYESWLNRDELAVPRWSSRPDVWRAAIDLARQPAPDGTRSFIHRDYQHFNVLWARERLTGVVDWAFAETGAPEVDIGHCRLNLTILFGPDVADDFLAAYTAEAGRQLDPWWDVSELLSYDENWRRFVPVQVAGRCEVDDEGMNGRVEELLERALRRV